MRFLQATRKRRMPRWIVLAIVAAVLMGCSRVSTNPSSDGGLGTTEAGPVKDYGSAPDFSLPNVTGGTFRLAAQRRVVVLTFVTADCTEDCPKVEAVLRSVAQRLGERGELGSDVEIASVEIDPSFNSIGAVKELRRRLWPARGWAFLRGAAPATRQVLRAYDVHVLPRRTGKDLEHESLVYVISPALRKTDLLEPRVNLTPGDVLKAIETARASS